MGTNFYFMSRDKELIQTHFAKKYSWGVADEEYSIVDEPYLGYEVHLNKLSVGWRPIFQKHRGFKTFNQLKKFYFAHKEKLDIYDEYGKAYTWDEYYDRVYRHSLREKEPVKWVYEIDKIFNDTKPTLHTVRCSEEEAELHIPFEHCLYDKTEREAARRFGVPRGYRPDERYWNDPDYLFDWTEGDFS